MTGATLVPLPLPAGLEGLAELALDLRWTWSHGADHLWRHLDPDVWETTRNPWVLLQSIPRDRLAAHAGDPDFRGDLERLLVARQAYLQAPPALAAAGATLTRPAAYFSLEFGLGEAIPLYAGGLGVLAGDHLKAASDLGVPLEAVGLLYQEGYFRQSFDAAGRQEALYPYNDPTTLPIVPCLAPSGEWLTVSIPLPGRELVLRAWRATVGRVTLHLLDSNVPINDPVDRGITGKLYGDGPEMRLRQEMVLGLGGFRMLERLGIQPGACHLNEGHAAFVVLERARAAMHEHDLSFHEALVATRAGNVFTTHTPVAAGLDAFSPAMLAKYFPAGRGYLASLGLGFDELLALGRRPGAADDEPFRPTYLALRGASHVNAVSAVHAGTSRALFHPIFPRWPLAEIPIGHVTNGVHMPSWDSRAADRLWTSSCGSDRWRRPSEGLEQAVAAIDDQALWAFRGQAREELVGRVRARLTRQLGRRGSSPESIEAATRVLDPDVLTLGLARRFAAYKRPNLLLRGDGQGNARLRRLLQHARTPVQLLVAGKAHPDDANGKSLVEAWLRFTADPDVRQRCVFLEDYDLALAQELVQGVDVWINTPRPPWEACGTSGMKVLVNGGLNLSIRDGWWAEAYEPDCGWAIGGATDADPHDAGGDGDAEARDAADAAALFGILEQEVIPAFYERDAAGLPRAWLARVRASLARLTPRFSANRMLRDYVLQLYQPAEAGVAARLADGAARARAIHARRCRLTRLWSQIRFGRLDVQATDAGHRFGAEVFLNEVPLEDVQVELYADPTSPGGAPTSVRMEMTGPLPGSRHGFSFTATVADERPPDHWTPRVVAADQGPSDTFPGAFRSPSDLPLIAWHH